MNALSEKKTKSDTHKRKKPVHCHSSSADSKKTKLFFMKYSDKYRNISKW